MGWVGVCTRVWPPAYRLRDTVYMGNAGQQASGNIHQSSRYLRGLGQCSATVPSVEVLAFAARGVAGHGMLLVKVAGGVSPARVLRRQGNLGATTLHGLRASSNTWYDSPCVVGAGWERGIHAGTAAGASKFPRRPRMSAPPGNPQCQARAVQQQRRGPWPWPWSLTMDGVMQHGGTDGRVESREGHPLCSSSAGVGAGAATDQTGREGRVPSAVALGAVCGSSCYSTTTSRWWWPTNHVTSPAAPATAGASANGVPRLAQACYLRMVLVSDSEDTGRPQARGVSSTAVCDPNLREALRDLTEPALEAR